MFNLSIEWPGQDSHESAEEQLICLPGLVLLVSCDKKKESGLPLMVTPVLMIFFYFCNK
jgi:hypothetical protein